MSSNTKTAAVDQAKEETVVERIYRIGGINPDSTASDKLRLIKSALAYPTTWNLKPEHLDEVQWEQEDLMTPPISVMQHVWN